MMKTLNSVNAPLRIDVFTLSDTGGAIGMTICPGKKRPASMSGDWDRDLDMDLLVVKDWGADIVVTLLEDFEFTEVAVEPLGERVLALGMKWVQLPIPDKCAPGVEFLDGWRKQGAAIHACLAQGGKVLIHCMGGIGRTETVAAQILMERGMLVTDAIVAIRHARLGAIETAVQEQYLHNCRLEGSNHGC